MGMDQVVWMLVVCAAETTRRAQTNAGFQMEMACNVNVAIPIFGLRKDVMMAIRWMVMVVPFSAP